MSDTLRMAATAQHEAKLVVDISSPVYRDRYTGEEPGKAVVPAGLLGNGSPPIFAMT
jgi:hypothetical protein